MTREEFLKIIDEINDKVYSIYDIKEMKIFSSINPVQVAENLDIDRFRWFLVSITVYKVGQWYIGLRGPTILFSENMDWKDTGYKVMAFEMVEIPSVTYKKKENPNV